MEIRFHGRGGQGAVTCAKIVATVYAKKGKSVQAFGDYAAERSGAPVRSYARVSDEIITNRNKVYTPNHLLILDENLLTPQTLSGLHPGGFLLINTTLSAQHYAEKYRGYRVAVVDATSIARKHGIGTRTVTIINTALAGAFAKLMDLSLDLLAEAYRDLGLGQKTDDNIAAAKEAYEAVSEMMLNTDQKVGAELIQKHVDVLDLTQHLVGLPTGLLTGTWRVELPKYVSNLAPCNDSCPAGNDVVGFIQALSNGDEEEAARILGETTPFAAICGRVCPAFCMMSCNRKELDGAVNIRGLERLVGDNHLIAMTQPIATSINKKIAIIGGGPAGLSAAYQLALAGYKVEIFELEAHLGGVLVTGIPNYRLPRKELEREIQAILALGVTAHLNEKITDERLKTLQTNFDAVIVATGLQKLRSLSLPGTDLKGVEQGIHFLHKTNFNPDLEVSGHVVVLGGGNTAMDCARNALRAGANKVTVVYRRTQNEMPAISEEIHEAIEEGVELLFQRSPVSFIGDTHVRQIKIAEVELGAPDDSGRQRPIVTAQTHLLGCDRIIMALGQSANQELFDKNWDTSQLQEKTLLNVFFSGDLLTYEGTVVHAIGHGRRVANHVRRFLGEAIKPFSKPDHQTVVTPQDVRMDFFSKAPPEIQAAAKPAERKHSNEEVNKGLEDATESDRCFSCGQCTSCDTCLVYCPEGIIYRDGDYYTIDLDYCKGCSVCVTECPRMCMEMVNS